MEHHEFAMYSGHYTASVYCCERTFYCNDHKITICDMNHSRSSYTTYINCLWSEFITRTLKRVGNIFLPLFLLFLLSHIKCYMCSNQIMITNSDDYDNDNDNNKIAIMYRDTFVYPLPANITVVLAPLISLSTKLNSHLILLLSDAFTLSCSLDVIPLWEISWVSFRTHCLNSRDISSIWYFSCKKTIIDSFYIRCWLEFAMFYHTTQRQ